MFNKKRLTQTSEALASSWLNRPDTMASTQDHVSERVCEGNETDHVKGGSADHVMELVGESVETVLVEGTAGDHVTDPCDHVTEAGEHVTKSKENVTEGHGTKRDNYEKTSQNVTGEVVSEVTRCSSAGDAVGEDDVFQSDDGHHHKSGKQSDGSYP